MSNNNVIVEVNTVKRSIFKQDNYLKRYEPTLKWTERTFIHYGSTYELNPSFELEFISSNVISTIEIETPLLKVGDKFYFEEKEITVSIKEVIRTDKDSVLYIVTDNVVEDYESKRNVEELFKSKEFTNLMPIENYKKLKLEYEELLSKVKKHNDKRFVSKIDID